ncbi:MAG: hypothetical protein IJ680_01110 [Paludibacteraceae bacterium]|nr:hypothetical protein [Paludibacteraceae bacterium]
MNRKNPSAQNSRRTHRHVFTLNDSEQRVFERFCRKYRVQNRSKLVRELLMKSILKRFDEDHPTLF